MKYYRLCHLQRFHLLLQTFPVATIAIDIKTIIFVIIPHLAKSINQDIYSLKVLQPPHINYPVLSLPCHSSMSLLWSYSVGIRNNVYLAF